MSNFKRGIFLSFLTFFMTACIVSDDFEFEKFAGPVNWNPEIYAPVAHGNFTLADFLNVIDDEDSTIQTDGEGLVHIIYVEDSIFSYEASELVDFPQNIAMADTLLQFNDIDMGECYFSTAVTLDLLSQRLSDFNPLRAADGSNAPFPPVDNTNAGNFNILDVNEFEYVSIDSAEMALRVVNNLPVEISIGIDLYDVTNGYIVAGFDLPPIAPGDSVSSINPIADVTISNNLQVRLRNLSSPGAADAPVNLSDEISLRFTLNNIAFSEGSIKIPELSFEEISDEYSLTIAGAGGEDIKLFRGVIKTGTININLNSDIPLNGAMMLELPSAKNSDGSPAVIPITFNNSQSSFTYHIPISGIDIDMTTGTTGYNTLPVRVLVRLDETTGYVPIVSEDKISVSVSLSNAEPSYISGDFGKQAVNIDQGEIDLDIDLLNRLYGKFILEEPQLKLSVQNSVGVPSRFYGNFKAFGSGNEQVDLNPDPLDVAYPKLVAEGEAEGTLIYDRSNSNIVDFIALPPNRIEYSGYVLFNPDGAADQAQPNFITDESAVTIGIEADMPIDLKTELLGILDTMAMDPSDFEGIDSVSVMLFVTNGIPLDISLELSFVDTITGTGMGKEHETGVILAAETDSEGNVTGKTITSTEIVLASEDFYNLKNATGIAIDAKLNSPEGGSVPARIYADSEISISIGIRTVVSGDDLTDSFDGGN